MPITVESASFMFGRSLMIFGSYTIDRPSPKRYPSCVRRILQLHEGNMNVLITGASSGYGLETARHFHDRGWTVVATMRTPRPDVFPDSERMRVLRLDVTDPASIAAAVEAAGPI